MPFGARSATFLSDVTFIGQWDGRRQSRWDRGCLKRDTQDTMARLQ
jgi:hypothetical protein